MKKLIWLIILIIIIVGGFYLLWRAKSPKMSGDKNYGGYNVMKQTNRPSYG